MTLLNTIKSAQLQSRKDRDADKTALLTTLIGDASMVGKNDGNRESTEAEVIKVIKKFIANGNETLSLIAGSAPANTVAKVQRELSILAEFLPKQLEGEELIKAIGEVITELNATSIKDMGKVMKTLKEKYDGNYDGTTASVIIKGKLNVTV